MESNSDTEQFIQQEITLNINSEYTLDTVDHSQVINGESEPQFSSQIKTDTSFQNQITDNNFESESQEEQLIIATPESLLNNVNDEEGEFNQDSNALQTKTISNESNDYQVMKNEDDIGSQDVQNHSNTPEISITNTLNPLISKLTKQSHQQSKSITFASPNTPQSNQPQQQKRASPLPQKFDLNSDSDDSFIQDTELGISEVIQAHTEIQSMQKPKINYGGWRNVENSVVYMNAVSQTTTAREIKNKNAPTMYHRDSQTIVMIEKSIQAPKQASTQMDTQFLYLSPIGDRVIVARPYITAMEEERRFLEKLVVCQSIARRFLAMKHISELREMTTKKIKQKNEITQKQVEAEEARKNREIDRRLHPKTLKDFELLYNGLEEWRVKQLETFHAHKMDGKQKTKYMVDLINTEASLIKKIDTMKVVTGKQNHDRNVDHFIEKMSKSKEWSIKGQLDKISVDTPEIIRAKYLKDVYDALKTPISDIDTRLQILLRIKQTVKEYDCNLSREIIDLLDREGDLMTRGRKSDTLLGLRQRTLHLFFQFARNPEFNPVAKAFNNNPLYQKVESIYYCKGCSQYLSASQFGITSAISKLGRCRVCLEEEEIAISRHDDHIYQKLIRHMKRDALKNGPFDNEESFVDVVQEMDLRHLVEVIWGGKSAISGISVMDRLELCRWDKNKALTPWNLMLVTKTECKSHLEGGVSYTDAFLRMVHGKHEVGRAYFSKLFESSKIDGKEREEVRRNLNAIMT